jgi:hypothetical protein
MQRNRYVISSTRNKSQWMECNGGSYNQYNKNKMDGLQTRPKFEQGLQFYVPWALSFLNLKVVLIQKKSIKAS